MSRWPNDKIDQLKALWKEGKSSGEIAKLLRVSRNAVIGKLTRLGLTGDAPERTKPVTQGRVDPQKHIDQRDLSILDALVDGEDARSIARRFSVAPEHVRDLWDAREACA